MEEIGGVVAFILIIGLLACPFYAWYLYQQNQHLNAALNQANDNIELLDEEINSASDMLDGLNLQITNARDEAWSDYNTMGTTLEYLMNSNQFFFTYPTISSSTK
jgi:hypothetical protein